MSEDDRKDLEHTPSGNLGSDLIHDDLRGLVAAGQVVAVVGAGVTARASGNALVASWIGLLENGIERCVGLKRGAPVWIANQRAALKSGDLDKLLSVAEQVGSQLDAPAGGEFRRWLRETVGNLPIQQSDVLEALKDLNIPLVTTNYDGLLEEVTGWRAVTWRDSARAERVLRGDEQGVLHLHGYWEDPESVVLGIRSYEEVLNDPHAQAVLRGLRLTRSLLFVGFGAGLADPNFRSLLRWTRETFAGSEYRQFRLARASESAALQQQHPPEERIFVVPYGESHNDLAPFLRSLGGPDPESQTSSALAISPVPPLLEQHIGKGPRTPNPDFTGVQTLSQQPEIIAGDFVDREGSGPDVFEQDSAEVSGSAHVEPARSPLAGPKIKAIRLALESAFPTIALLAIMVREELDKDLAVIAAGQNLTEVVFSLIIWAESQGRIEELINGARCNSPDDLLLLAIENELLSNRSDMSDVAELGIVDQPTAGEQFEELRLTAHTALPVRLGTASNTNTRLGTSRVGEAQRADYTEVEVKVGDVSARAILPPGTQTEIALAVGSDIEAVFQLRRRT